MPLRFGILTASDRAASGERTDASGPALSRRVQEWGGSITRQEVLPDDRRLLAEKMREWAASGAVDVLLVTGGTGFGPRDVTPEATRDVIERETPGLTEAMRAASLNITPHAMLSRSAAGLRGTMLIINLPGSPRGALENLEVVLPVLEHAIQMLAGGSEGH